MGGLLTFLGSKFNKDRADVFALASASFGVSIFDLVASTVSKSLQGDNVLGGLLQIGMQGILGIWMLRAAARDEEGIKYAEVDPSSSPRIEEIPTLRQFLTTPSKEQKSFQQAVAQLERVLINESK
jgi:hypothetical protein